MPTGLSHRRRVDDRHHLVDVLEHGPVEQRLVTVLQADEEHVLLELRRLTTVVAHHAPYLVLEREHARRQQPPDTERIPLGLGERRALVQQRILEQRHAAGIGAWQVGHEGLSAQV